MVMAKPIQLTMVSAVPLKFSGACFATSEENKGESAITTKPQKNKNIKKTVKEVFNKNIGDNKQQRQDKIKAVVAIFFASNSLVSKPLNMQANAPDAITKNDSKGTSR